MTEATIKAVYVNAVIKAIALMAVTDHQDPN